MSPACEETDGADDGFTLVEVLVTLTLVALLATVIASGLVQMRAIYAVTQKIDARMEMDALGNYLDALIANARLLPLIYDNPEQLLVLEGHPDRIRFVSTIRTGSDQFALREIELVPRKPGPRLDLVQASFPRRSTNSRKLSADIASAPTIMPDIKSLTFEYLGASSGNMDEQLGWKSTWNEPATLPRSVRVEIEASRNGQTVKLERIINLKLAN